MIAELLLLLAPALALVAVLLGRRYPGERVLARLRCRRIPRRWARPGATVPAGRRRPVVLPRGGRLVGAAVAARPPPGG